MTQNFNPKDPVLLEIVWSRLNSLVTEHATNIIRTSFSPIVREAGDVATALFDRQGRMLAHGQTGTPGHLIPMTRTIMEFLAKFPVDTIREGDSFVTNDPWLTTGHQFDVTIATPVFRDGSLVGFVASTAHHADVGGSGWGANANDVFEEGLIIPIMRFQTAGVFNETLLAMVRSNVREPDAVIGDLNAQVAANETAGHSFVHILREYGVTDPDALVNEILERSEAASRAAIREVPNGTYTSELRLDGFDKEIVLKLTLKVLDEHIEADFTGTSPQIRKGINVCFNYASGYTAFALRLAIGRDIPHNYGSLSTFRTSAPRGTVLSCEFPAPVSARHMVGQMVPNLVLKALAQAVPIEVMADGAGSVWGVVVQGTHPNGRTYASVSLLSGGVGARPAKDGLSTTQFPTGSGNVPVEVVELEAPILYTAKELIADSGGAGAWRGGLGQRIAFEVDPAGNSCVLNLMCERTLNEPDGLLGGNAGRRGAVSDASGKLLHPKSRIVVTEPTKVVLETPGGGGFGSALERHVDLVAEDVRLGRVSPESARAIYGVVIDVNGAVDVATSHALRLSLQDAA